MSKSNVIAFTGLKGGTGVSSLAVLFCNEISETHKVLLIDTDIQQSCIIIRERDLKLFPSEKPKYPIASFGLDLFHNNNKKILKNLNNLIDYIQYSKDNYDYIVLDICSNLTLQALLPSAEKTTINSIIYNGIATKLLSSLDSLYVLYEFINFSKITDLKIRDYELKRYAEDIVRLQNHVLLINSNIKLSLIPFRRDQQEIEPIKDKYSLPIAPFSFLFHNEYRNIKTIKSNIFLDTIDLIDYLK